MQALRLSADPDPEIWVAVPSTYPDPRGASPAQWARTVVGEHLTAVTELDEDPAVAEPTPAHAIDPAQLELLLTDLAESEQGSTQGPAYLYLAPEGGPLHKVRLRAVVTETLGPTDAVSPLDPSQDEVDAEHLGRGVRSIVAGVTYEGARDLLVTIVYRWDLGWVSVLLTMPTLDPGQAVAMLPLLDDFADDIWVEDERGELVMAAEGRDG